MTDDKFCSCEIRSFDLDATLLYVKELLNCDYVTGNGVTAFDGSPNCMRHLREHIDTLRIVFEELQKSQKSGGKGGEV